MVMEKMGLEAIPHAKASNAPYGTVRVGTLVRRSVADTAMETHRTSGRREVLPLQSIQNTKPPSVGKHRIIHTHAPVEVSRKIVWPFPNVSHLAYIRTNKLGRVSTANARTSSKISCVPLVRLLKHSVACEELRWMSSFRSVRDG